MNPWSLHRKKYIIGGLSAVGFMIVAATLFATLYRVPSCSDGVKNQGEFGVDCGGPCHYLCSAQAIPPSVRFVRQVSPEPGRTDVIAYIDNPNANTAVKGATFTVSLYGSDNVLVASKKGTADIEPNVSTPIYIPDFFSGYQQVVHAFLNFDDASLLWYKYTDDRVIPKLVNYTTDSMDTAPHVTAVFQNPSATPLFDVRVIATAFDANGNAIAASQTVIPTIPPQNTANALFTWNTPFPTTAARFDIVPVIPLP